MADEGHKGQHLFFANKCFERSKFRLNTQISLKKGIRIMVIQSLAFVANKGQNKGKRSAYSIPLAQY